MIASRNTVAALTWPISKPSSLMRPRTASGDVTRSTPHRHPSTDAPGHEPGPCTRRGAEQHAAGGRHEAVAEPPIRGLLDVDDGRATCRR